MTVCIAIRNLSYSEGTGGIDPKPVERIVTICDRMLSYTAFTVDDAVLKRFKIHPRWRMMFSGNDISQVTPLARIVQGHLASREGHLEEVADSFRNAFHEHSHLLAVDLILGKYGHTMSSWRQKGLSEFGPEEFARINQQIEQVEVGVQFLVCGFSPEGQGHIFTVEEEWTRGYRHVAVSHHDLDGFSLIGSGTTAALSSLLRKALPFLNLPELVYRACEAKMLAEKALGVGKGTVLSVLECNPSDRYVGERFVTPNWDTFRTIWENEGQPPIPETALKFLQQAINNSIDWQRPGEPKAG
jgi:hypothetical protein